MLPRVCYDTVIHSGLIKKDLRPVAEMAAVEEIERLHLAGRLDRVTTPVAKDEERRTIDPIVRAALEEAGEVVSAVQASPVILGFGHQDFGGRGFIAYPLMSDIDEKLVSQLVAIGTGRNDARAIAFAVGVNGNCQYFITLDTRDLLPHCKKIATLLVQRIQIMRPTEFIEEWNSLYAAR